MKQELFEFNSIQYMINIGQDKYDNFNLIDISESTDIWFHVTDQPSCHVILKTELKINKIPKQVIKKCAYLCKINSKAKKLKTCSVTYTSIDNITKTDIIGQVITKNCKIVNV